MQDAYIPDSWIGLRGDNGRYLKRDYAEPWTSLSESSEERIAIYLGPELVILDKLVVYLADNVLDVIVNGQYELMVSGVFIYSIAHVSESIYNLLHFN